MKIAAQYLRVSTSDQADRYSLAAQEEACLNYAQTHKLTIKATFTDAVSGQTANRPGLQDALAKAAAGEFSDLVLYDHSRLGRNVKTSNEIREQFQDAGIQIHYTTTGTYDSESETGVLLDALGDAMSEIEIKRFVRRSRGGKRKSAEAGNVVIGGQVPFGFTRDATGKKLLKDPVNAKHVKWMFTQFNKGNSLRWIAKQMQKNGIPTAYGKAWTPSTITKMLRRETYVGRWHYGQTKMIKGKKVPQPTTDWIEVKIPTLVSDTAWNAAQKQLSINARKSAKNTKYPYLVRNRIVCSDCGRSYRGRAKHYKKVGGGTTSHFYYKHHPEKNGCKNDNLWLRRDNVESDVKAELLGWLKDPDHKWETYIQEQNLTAESLQSELNKISRKLKKLDEDFKRARQFLVEGTLDKDNFEEESHRIGNQKDVLKKKQTELEGLQRPDYYHDQAELTADHDLRNFWNDIKEDQISEDEWFTYIDQFDVKISVLPMNKRKKRRFRITSTVGNRTVTVLK